MPVVNAFPELTLTTSRIVLRPLADADIPDVQLSCADELTQRWLTLPTPYTLAAAADYCTVKATRSRKSGNGIHFAMADPGSGRLLGSISLRSRGRVDLAVYSKINADLER
jgi:RimJ/RimL family protein N-acetyltransferase